VSGVDNERLAAQLEAHPDYRVVRRLEVGRHGEALTGPTVRRAAIVDTETTGTDHGRDHVIELAVVVFEYCAASGAVGGCSVCMTGLRIRACRYRRRARRSTASRTRWWLDSGSTMRRY
jgi:DNA polymerase-3 subunit epsilon